MYPYGQEPYQAPPLPPRPTAKRPVVAVIAGWVLIALGGLVALSGLFGGSGFGGTVGPLLVGAAIAIPGAMLVWRFTSWKLAAPGAIVALLLGGAMTPASPEAPAPANNLVAPTTAAGTTPSETTTSGSATTTISAPPATTTSRTTVSAAPTSRAAHRTTDTTVTAARLVPTTTADGDGGGGGGVRDLYYKNCKAARAAGAAPLIRGRDAGYRSQLDGDGDGIACER